MTAELSSKLLDEAKKLLQFTWDDSGREEKIKLEIKAGAARLQLLSAAPLDFEKDEHAKSLLLQYVLYAESNAVADFEASHKDTLSEFAHVKAAEYERS